MLFGVVFVFFGQGWETGRAWSHMGLGCYSITPTSSLGCGSKGFSLLGTRGHGFGWKKKGMCRRTAITVVPFFQGSKWQIEWWGGSSPTRLCPSLFSLSQARERNMSEDNLSTIVSFFIVRGLGKRRVCWHCLFNCLESCSGAVFGPAEFLREHFCM